MPPIIGDSFLIVLRYWRDGKTIQKQRLTKCETEAYKLARNASEFCMYLLNTAHVTSVMGDAFGEPSCVRFSFANNIENIERAWVRIIAALNKLK